MSNPNLPYNIAGLMTAMMINPIFFKHFKHNPQSAIADGYKQNQFNLSPDEVELIASLVEAEDSLESFAGKVVALGLDELALNRNGRVNGSG